MKSIKISNLPLKYYLPIAIVVLVATYIGALNQDIVGSFAFLFVVSGIFFFIGGKIPIFGSWFGGAILLPLFGGSALVYFHLLPKYAMTGVSSLMSSGFVNVFLASIIVGSILSMDRKILLSVAFRMIPCILVGQLFVFLFLYLASLILGITPLKSLFMIGLPNYAGGSSGALAVVPSIYSDFFHHSIGTWSAKFIVFLNISNVFCVLIAGLLNQLGKKHPKWTGNGELLKGASAKKQDNNEDDQPILEHHIKAVSTRLGIGFLVSIAFLVLGNIFQTLIPQINYIAWAAIMVIIVKAIGLLDNEICVAASEWQTFVVKIFLPILITGIGISSLDLEQVISYLSPINLIVILLAVIGAVIGTTLMSFVFKLYPIDTAIGIGLQLGNLGGTGAITTLTTAERMEMMPFATIANRLSGALMVVEISLLLPYFA